jgi:hypothetical protein
MFHISALLQPWYFNLRLKTMCVGFQALTVLEYLVAHGSERAIDEIREHSYQITVNKAP